MSFFDDDSFDDDPFEDIVRGFFGPSNQRGFKRHSSKNIIQNENDDRNIDFVETDKYLFLVFELSGYSKEDLHIDLEGKELTIIAKKKEASDVCDYFCQKMRKGISLKRKIPDFVNVKNYKFNFNNGILEVRFDKK